MQKNYLQTTVLSVIVIITMMIGFSVFAQQKVENKVHKAQLKQNVVLQHQKRTVQTAKDKKNLPAVEMKSSKSSASYQHELKKEQHTTTATPIQPKVESITAPSVTLNTPEPKVEFEILQEPITRKSESTMNIVAEKTANYQRESIYEMSTQELKLMYQHARPATQAKMMADPIIKQRLESNE